MTMKTNKYKISQELMNSINEWKLTVNGWVIDTDILFPLEIEHWWAEEPKSDIERNNRLIALIQYVNVEDVFEVEKPKRWIVRSTNLSMGAHSYIELYDEDMNRLIDYNGSADSMLIRFNKYVATRFDSKEEAEQWTNPMMEAVEVEDD